MVVVVMVMMVILIEVMYLGVHNIFAGSHVHGVTNTRGHICTESCIHGGHVYTGSRIHGVRLAKGQGPSQRVHRRLGNSLMPPSCIFGIRVSVATCLCVAASVCCISSVCCIVSVGGFFTVFCNIMPVLSACNKFCCFCFCCIFCFVSVANGMCVYAAICQFLSALHLVCFIFNAYYLYCWCC